MTGFTIAACIWMLGKGLFLAAANAALLAWRCTFPRSYWDWVMRRAEAKSGRRLEWMEW
jgi:hypothetical protein